MGADRLPTIDLEAADVAQQFDQACREEGFFYLKNHGISAETTRRAFDAAVAFFARPVDEKTLYHIDQSHPHQRGYVPINHERLDPGVSADLKESFDLGVDLAPDHPDVLKGQPFASPNVWPDGMPEFKRDISAYHDAMMTLSRRLVAVTADALSVDPSVFQAGMADPIGNLRLLHYPPQAVNPSGLGDELGCGAHTDYGFLTILAQDETGGLQLETTEGKWIDVPPQPGTFVVNLGELLSRWTNDRYQARRHRVINKSGKDRYSIPFFLDPAFDAVVAPLQDLVPAGETPKYRAVTGGAWLTHRLDETFTERAAS